MKYKIAPKLKKKKKYDYSKVKTACEEVYYREGARCQITGRRIHEPFKYCFAHILAKGQYPKYADDPNNIVLVHDVDVHKLVDSITAKHHPEIIETLERGEKPDINHYLKLYQNA